MIPGPNSGLIVKPLGYWYGAFESDSVGSHVILHDSVFAGEPEHPWLPLRPNHKLEQDSEGTVTAAVQNVQILELSDVGGTASIGKTQSD